MRHFKGCYIALLICFFIANCRHSPDSETAATTTNYTDPDLIVLQLIPPSPKDSWGSGKLTVTNRNGDHLILSFNASNKLDDNYITRTYWDDFAGGDREWDIKFAFLNKGGQEISKVWKAKPSEFRVNEGKVTHRIDMRKFIGVVKVSAKPDFFNEAPEKFSILKITMTQGQSKPTIKNLYSKQTSIFLSYEKMSSDPLILKFETQSIESGKTKQQPELLAPCARGARLSYKP